MEESYMASTEELLQLALDVVAETRPLILDYERRGFHEELKDNQTVVTEADRAAEMLARDIIGRRFPDHAIVGEEFPSNIAEAEYVWYLDPIDGTQNFVHGIPTYGTIVAVHHRGTPVVGVMDHPALDYQYYAGRGVEAFKNGRRLDLNSRKIGKQELVAIPTISSYQRLGVPDLFSEIAQLHPYLRVYYDCISFGFAAQGSLGAVLSAGCHIWDIAAAPVIIEEAGGVYYELFKDEDAEGDLYHIILGKREVVDSLLPKVLHHYRAAGIKTLL